MFPGHVHGVAMSVDELSEYGRSVEMASKGEKGYIYELEIDE